MKQFKAIYRILKALARAMGDEVAPLAQIAPEAVGLTEAEWEQILRTAGYDRRTRAACGANDRSVAKRSEGVPKSVGARTRAIKGVICCRPLIRRWRATFPLWGKAEREAVK